MNTELPVVVVGAGPVGLAAAAHLLERGLTPLVLEAGRSVGSGMLRWAHVRMFSPWEYTIDRAARALLEQHGWQAPDAAAFPTGGDVVEHYLRPLAAVPVLAAHLRLGARVTAVARQRRDLMKNAGRDESPFVVRFEHEGREHEVLARGVIDASGTVESPNPLGSSGLPALGESALRDRIFYGMPDVLGAHRARYAGKRVLVVGSGHSAFNVLNDLAGLAGQGTGTRIHWAIRRESLRRVLGGGENDQLRERGQLGLRVGRLVEEGRVELATGFHVERLEAGTHGVTVHDGTRAIGPFDEIVASTGFRPDLGWLSELRIALDTGTQAPVALAPLIDPNLHSCGSVRPHGAEELRHPDAGVYIVGMKSYGRAPTFLLLTGYEQVRSVVAALAGDWDAARRVELVLPETGVCITHFLDDPAEEGAAAAGCCDATTVRGCDAAGCAPNATPEPAACCASPAHEVAVDCCGGPSSMPDACCKDDAQTKAAGRGGCGCGAGDPGLADRSGQRAAA